MLDRAALRDAARETREKADAARAQTLDDQACSQEEGAYTEVLRHRAEVRMAQAEPRPHADPER